LARYRNDTGSVLNAASLGLLIGPGEEFGSDLHVPGCTEVTPPAQAAKGKDKAASPASEEPQQ
jgi:hypothetical protein